MHGDRLTTHETKAARLIVLYRLRAEGRLDGLSDAALARAFGTRRETIWKDRQALAVADRLYSEVMAREPWAGPGLTVNETAARLGCDGDAVRAMLRAGLLRGAQRGVGGRWHIPESEIERVKRKE